MGILGLSQKYTKPDDEKKKSPLGLAQKYIDLPAETAIPPVAEVSDPSLTPDLPPVDPTGGFRSPTSGVTEANALMAQKIAEENRARQIANQPNVTEMDSVFYPKTFDPAVTGQNALETERQRLAEVIGEPGPTIAKTELNLNPSISQVQGVPGNYSTTSAPVTGMPISDASATDSMAFGNTYKMPNNAVSRGTGRMMGVFNLFAQQLGLKDTGDYIDRMQELNRIIPEAPKEVQDGLRAITAEDNTWGEVFRAMKDNPGAVLSVVGESFPQMIPSLLAATGATVATGGNLFAGAAAVGATSGAMEFGNVLDEEIKASGIDLNDDEAVQELFNNAEFWGRARERGARRGIAIGVFDALSMGMAGKLVNMARGAGKGRLTVGGAAAADVAGVQGPLGSVGEFTAQMLEKKGGFRDGLNFGEIALEGVAEIVPGAGEVAVATTAGADPVAFAAKQTIRDINNAEFATTPEQVALERLSPQEMPLEAQIVDLQMRLRAVGQDKLAGTYGTWLDRLDTLKPEQLKFLKEKVEAEERKSAGVASLQPRVENVFESFLAQDPKEKAQLDQALEDTRTGPVLREMAKNMQLIGDRLHELGYSYNDVSTDPNAPQEIKNARNYLANAGIAMRLIKQLNANVKGFKGNRSVSDEDINKTIGRLQSVVVQDVLPRIEGAPPQPTVQTELPQPVAPTIDGELQPPSTPDTDSPVAPDVRNIALPKIQVPETPTVETDVPVAPAVQETAPQQPALPVAEEAPTVNPQEAEPVGREVPSKPVTSVQTPDGQAKFNVQGRVIELADLKKATGDLQPRDRSRKESTALAKERAGSMFNPERLLDDPTSGSGAPIIARDGTVMSGNGRVLTMQEVYASQPDSLTSYRSALETAGISTEGFSQPVFVRQLTDDMTVQELKRFADLSNTEAQAQMSMTERATRDSTRLQDSGIIDLYRGDFDINAAQNRGFVSEYAKKILSPTEQGAFVNSKGEISQEGISRVKNAILASAFDNPDTLATMLESSDENIKAISSAFMAAAPKFAQLKKQVANGRTEAQFDITPQLADMANLVSRLRRDGVKLQDYYSQSDMLSAPDPEVQSLVRAFYNEGLTRANSAKAMKEFLDFYTTEALQKESGGLLPDQTTASDIIESGRQRTEEKRNETKRQEQPGLELAASSNVERNDARSKQVPKRRNAKSGERTEAVKPAAERKVDDARSESAVEESVEGVVELRNAESTSPANADTREENTRGTKAGRVTIAQSQTLRQSLYRDAFADAGFEVDTAVNLPITRQYKILSDLVTKKFGLSFVEKPQQGAGYDQVNALLDAYHNLQWMTHTMAMPNTAIGLDGTLGLALPQNAWGGYLAAYVNKKQTDPATYQSDINPVAGPVILMPGRSNSFAHEWGHALDYHILDRIGNDWGRGVTGRIRTNLAKGEMVYADNAPQNVVEAMGDLMNVMFMENAEVSAEIMKIEGDVARLQAKQDKRTSGKPIKKLADMKEQLRQLREGSSKKRISKSQYRKNAETFATNNKSDAKYWTRPTEMFARAFEAYVAHNVEAAGGKTEFIAFENEAYEMAMDKVKGGDDRLALTYPNDPDRMRIFMAMDRLMDELRADVIQEGTVAEAPGDTDMIDAQADFHQEVDRTKKERIGIIEDQKRAWNEHRVMRQKVRDRPQRYKSALARFQDTAGVVIINTKRGILFNIANRYKDNPKAKALIESVIARVANDPGSTDNRVTVSGGAFEEAVRGAARRYAGKWATILEKHQLNSFSALDNKELRLFLTSDETAQTNAPEKIKRAAGDIRNKLLNPMYDYMRKNGLDVNYLPEGGFMPRMMDALLVADSKEKFVKGLPGEKKRGAKALYSDVIYENELGVIDVNDAEQAADLVKLARKLEGSLDESTAEAAAELKFKLKQIERESAKLDDPEVDPGDVEASIMQLQEEAAELHEQLYEELRDPYSTEAANDWYDRVVRRQVGDISRHGVQGSFAKSRKLPPEADTYMVDFYLDPVEAITNYISGVTRKVEFEKRFGTKNVPKGKRKRTSGNSIDPAGNVHDFMSYVSEEMAAAGMKEHEVRQIQKIVEVVTGTGAQTDYALETVLNTLNTFGTMALLPRAVISSIAEPMTAAITTGKVTDGFRTFAYSLDEFATFIRGQTARERKQYYKQLGSILGVIDLPESGEVIANRVGGTAEEDSKNAMRLGRFFFRTGLVSITNAQRRGSLRVGIRYLGQLGEQYTKPSSPRMKDRAREVLQDFGVRPEDMDQFAEFVMNLEKNEKGMYEIDSIIDRSGELSDMGEILALATRRFTDQTIQDPKIIDRPMYAESPVGRVVFGIQSFVASFTRNVLIASAKRVQREYENRGLASAIPYAGWNVALPLGSLFITHTLVSAVREMLLNPDKWEEEKEADNLEMYLLTLGLSRSGFIGRMDPLVNAMTSLKYQSDLSNMMVGASGAYYLKAVQRMAGVRPQFMGGSNSPNTVSAEYQFARGTYDMVVPTALSLLASHPGLGGAASALSGVSAAAFSSPAVKHYVLRSVIKQLYDEEYRPGRAGRKTKSKEKRNAWQ